MESFKRNITLLEAEFKQDESERSKLPIGKKAMEAMFEKENMENTKLAHEMTLLEGKLPKPDTMVCRYFYFVPPK